MLLEIQRVSDIARAMAKNRVAGHLVDLQEECRARGISVTQDNEQMRRELVEAMAAEYIRTAGADADLMELVFQSQQEGEAA